MTRICFRFIGTPQRLFIESSESERSSKNGTRLDRSQIIAISWNAPKDGCRGSVVNLTFQVLHAVEGGPKTHSTPAGSEDVQVVVTTSTPSSGSW